MTKEDLTSPGWECYGKQVEFHSGARTEGNINISPRRQKWHQENLNEETRALLAEDEKYFLKQSLSTPCLNAMRACGRIWIEDLQGRRYMDFQGNNVHQVGFANPAVIAAIKEQLEQLPFCTRRYTNRVAVDLARKLTEIAPGDLYLSGTGRWPR